MKTSNQYIYGQFTGKTLLNISFFCLWRTLIPGLTQTTAWETRNLWNVCTLWVHQPHHLTWALEPTTHLIPLIKPPYLMWLSPSCRPGLASLPAASYQSWCGEISAAQEGGEDVCGAQQDAERMVRFTSLLKYRTLQLWIPTYTSKAFGYGRIGTK